MTAQLKVAVSVSSSEEPAVPVAPSELGAAVACAEAVAAVVEALAWTVFSEAFSGGGAGVPVDGLAVEGLQAGGNRARDGGRAARCGGQSRPAGAQAPSDEDRQGTDARATTARRTACHRGLRGRLRRAGAP